MMELRNGKLKIIITFAILFVAVSVILLLVFFAGKKTHVVRFELDGGTLISGSLEQHVVRGQSAAPPTAVKEGAYLRGWSAEYKQITKDVVIYAIWEYNTTSGIGYNDVASKNYVEISSAYKYIRGEVYIGAYYKDKKVLGISDSAFSGCEQITKIFLLDGLLSIGNSAFSGCKALTEIEIPQTVVSIGREAFKNCVSLEKIILNEGIVEIGANAFDGCTALREIVIPESLVKMGADAFLNCSEELTITVTHSEGKNYSGWTRGWCADSEVILPEGLTRSDLRLDKIKFEISTDIIRPVRPNLKLDDFLNKEDGVEKEETSEKNDEEDLSILDPSLTDKFVGRLEGSTLDELLGKKEK